MSIKCSISAYIPNLTLLSGDMKLTFEFKTRRFLHTNNFCLLADINEMKTLFSCMAAQLPFVSGASIDRFRACTIFYHMEFYGFQRTESIL